MDAEGSKMKQDKSPFLIQAYRGYAGKYQLNLMGRVLENENFLIEPSDSKFKNLLESFRRFESDELPGVKVKIEFRGKAWEVETDDEGYYLLKVDLPKNILGSEQLVEFAQVHMLDDKGEILLTEQTEVFRTDEAADFGVISDIDDTVLQTYMNSRFKLRMLYVSFLKGAHQRLPMEGMVELFQNLQQKDKADIPFYYVSNSPWNIYNMLLQFLQLQKLPEGPILLRDFGAHLLTRKSDDEIHKLNTINKILETNPELPFVFFGDTASSDADYYAKFKQSHPQQVKAVYIRHTKDTKNARRVRQMIEEMEDPNFIMVSNSKEIEQHAKSIGLL